MTSSPRRTVLLPVDGSTNCERALKWYLKFSMRSDDKVIILHIIQPAHMAPCGGIVLETFTKSNNNSANIGARAGTELLGRYMKMCQAAGASSTAILHAGTSLGNSVIHVAIERGANVIVIASRGTGKARRVLLGTVSQYVVKHSGIPVLIVPPAKRSSASFSAEVNEAELMGFEEVFA